MRPQQRCPGGQWRAAERLLAHRTTREYEQNSNARAEYGKETLRDLSRVLTRECGRVSLGQTCKIWLYYLILSQKCQTPSGKLSWSHYCELLSISDNDKRGFYEKEAANSSWSVRELKRQIASSLFERLLLLSREDANKERVLALARNGMEIAEPV